MSRLNKTIEDKERQVTEQTVANSEMIKEVERIRRAENLNELARMLSEGGEEVSTGRQQISNSNRTAWRFFLNRTGVEVVNYSSPEI